VAQVPISDLGDGAGPVLRAALTRGAVFFSGWLVIGAPASGADLVADLAVGVLAAAAATWTSLRLLPAKPNRLRWGALTLLAGRILVQSVVAGAAVAVRAFSPRPDFRTGFLVYPVRIPAGPGRAAFGALTSLVPGTLPVGTDADGAILYHCLDLGEPVVAGLAADEALLARVLGETIGDD
jgi:multicomponent Na+:H+ antiporter subunit E